VVNAYVQFQAGDRNSGAINLTVSGEASDNAATFTTAAFDISSRPRTTAAAQWSPSPWRVVGESGINQRTPNLSAVLQEILSRPGWAPGNAVALIITGSGKRVAEAFDGVAAPVLHIEYIDGTTGQTVQATALLVPDVEDASSEPTIDYVPGGVVPGLKYASGPLGPLSPSRPRSCSTCPRKATSAASRPVLEDAWRGSSPRQTLEQREARFTAAQSKPGARKLAPPGTVRRQAARGKISALVDWCQWAQTRTESTPSLCELLLPGVAPT
jgi:hypothetical protein